MEKDIEGGENIIFSRGREYKSNENLADSSRAYGGNRDKQMRSNPMKHGNALESQIQNSVFRTHRIFFQPAVCSLWPFSDRFFARFLGFNTSCHRLA